MITPSGNLVTHFLCSYQLLGAGKLHSFGCAGGEELRVSCMCMATEGLSYIYCFQPPSLRGGSCTSVSCCFALHDPQNLQGKEISLRSKPSKTNQIQRGCFALILWTLSGSPRWLFAHLSAIC